MFLNDVEGMAYSLIYHERLLSTTFLQLRHGKSMQVESP